MGGAATAVAAGVSVLVVALQIAAMHAGFQGPLRSLISDYLGTPKSATLPWAGLGLALVGVPGRIRLQLLTMAAGLDVIFAAERVWRGGPLTVGNGPLIVLTGLIAVAGLRWSGAMRDNALRAAGWGALLIVASKAADAWLRISAIGRPTVLDEYAMLADHALGQPSWLVGRVLDAAGPVPSAVLHWLYIELPVAVLVVAVYQLRNVTISGFPRHHLMRTFLALGLFGPLIYLVFPVVGPVFAFGSAGQGWQVADLWPHLMPSAGLAPQPIAFDDFTPRNCMPSMHVGWALSVFLHSRRGPGWLRWGGAVWLLGTITATLGFGYHYGVDLVAGAVLCLTVESALRGRGSTPSRMCLVAGGATLFIVLLLSYRYLAVLMAQAPVFFGPLILGSLGLYAGAVWRQSRSTLARKSSSEPNAGVDLGAVGG